MVRMGAQACGQKVLEKTRESAQNPISRTSYLRVASSAGTRVSAVWKPTAVAFDRAILDFHLTTRWRARTSDIWQKTRLCKFAILHKVEIAFFCECQTAYLHDTSSSRTRVGAKLKRTLRATRCRDAGSRRRRRGPR
jgi:hypothetical protein